MNTAVKWFKWKGGKRQLQLVTQRSNDESLFDATCTGTTGTLNKYSDDE